MSKQMIKGLTMIALLVGLAFVTPSAQAQSSRRLVANVPFEFMVGNTSLPAGQYNVTAMTSAGETLRISDAKTAKSAIRLSNTITQAEPVEKGKLVFNRYGNRYFLAEVWTAGYSNGSKLLKSSAEKNLERERAAIASRTDTAPSRYERIEVALVRQ